MRLRQCSSRLHNLRHWLAERLRWSAALCPRMAPLGELKRAFHDKSAACRAFVGGDAEPAGEYHDNDFSFEEHRIQTESSKQHLLEDGVEAIASSNDGACTALPKDCWEKFHRRDNATARFYKERRYLLLEFPALTVQDPPQHFAEIGCGAGSSLLPILKANPSCRVTATDLSPTAVSMFLEAAKFAGVTEERMHAFAFDSTDLKPCPNPFQDLQADALLLIFTLAALSPAQMPAMLENAFQALRPGGLLLLRDHGLYDITHLRLQEKQREGHRLYRRSDGTLCYFFSVEDLREKMQSTRFEALECKYACVSLCNRKRELDMKRVFVHGVFRRPL